MTEHLPGTSDVEWWADRLTGGVTAEDVAELGGLINFAATMIESGCNCTHESDGEEFYTAICLGCEALSLRRALDGEDRCHVAFGEVQE